MTCQIFDTPGPVWLRVQNKAGEVRLVSHAQSTTEVEISGADGAGELLAATRVEHQQSGGGHRVTVEVPLRTGLLRSLFSGDNDVLVAVRVPEGCSVEVETAAGNITAEGSFGGAQLHTASGDISAGTVQGDLDVHTATGDVSIGSVGGEVKLTTASGDVRCGSLARGGVVKTATGDVGIEAALGHLSVTTASGDIKVGELNDGCRLQSASGDQQVRRLVAGRSLLHTASGDLVIGIARGTAVAVEAETLSGDMSSEIELGAEDPVGPGSGGAAGARAELHARTVSGDVRIKRAAR